MSKIKKVRGTLLAVSVLAVAAGCSTSSHKHYYTYDNSSQYGETTTRDTTATASTRDANASNMGGTGQASETEQGASIPLYQEAVRVGTREIDAGSVRLRKVVTTETMNQPVQIRRETLVIDREPAGAQASQQGASPAAFQQQETVIRLKRYEPVVETQVIEAGRIVAQKKSQIEQQNVQRQVRREDIQVEKIGNPENVVISDTLKASAKTEGAGGAGTSGSQTQGAGSSGSTKQP
jgi:uncharacterized protein (TIGR02271 family)